MSRKHKILVVDDDPAMINLVIYHFEQLDQEYEFLQARDGESGYKVAMKEQPDLIILDWEMPGLSGIDMLHLLKKTLKRLPYL
jgi:DNA-binding response OmpR family regulator